MADNDKKNICDGKNFALEKLEEVSRHHYSNEQEGICPVEGCPIGTLKRIDLNTQQILKITEDTSKVLDSHGRILETIATTQQKYMGAIAKNTKRVAINLNEYNKANNKMVSLLSGKKQVPISIFLVILASIGIITIMMFAAFTHYQLILDESSLKVTHQNQVNTNVTK